MSRHARVLLPRVMYHLVQRGHNREAIFPDEDHLTYFLSSLHDIKEVMACKIFAFCIMTNHVHLVAQHADQPDQLSRLMSRLTARQTHYFNRTFKRTGTAWEGRFHSSAIEGDRYLLTCCR